MNKYLKASKKYFDSETGIYYYQDNNNHYSLKRDTKILTWTEKKELLKINILNLRRDVFLFKNRILKGRHGPDFDSINRISIELKNAQSKYNDFVRKSNSEPKPGESSEFYLKTLLSNTELNKTCVTRIEINYDDLPKKVINHYNLSMISTGGNQVNAKHNKITRKSRKKFTK